MSKHRPAALPEYLRRRSSRAADVRAALTGIAVALNVAHEALSHAQLVLGVASGAGDPPTVPVRRMTKQERER